jgi:hypothetical protein
MRGRRGFQRAVELYTDSWDRSMVHQRWTRLGFVGGSLGRHRALSLGVQMAVSVAGWLGIYVSGFRAEAGEVVHGVVSSVGCGAGQGCRHDRGLMPCRRVCSARPGGVQVHVNASPTLRVLGGTVASGWHGRGTVYDGSEVAASRGIGRGRAGEFNGEVTGREVVGGSLPRLGVHDGQWRRPWRRRGTLWVSAAWGRARVPTGMVRARWGFTVVGVIEEKGVLAGWPRAPPLPLDAK